MLPRLSSRSPLGRLLKSGTIMGSQALAEIVGLLDRIGDRPHDRTEQPAPSPLFPTPRGRRDARRLPQNEDHSHQVRHFADGVRVTYGRFPIIIQEPHAMLADLWKTTGHSAYILSRETQLRNRILIRRHQFRDRLLQRVDFIAVLRRHARLHRRPKPVENGQRLPGERLRLLGAVSIP
jgi:hypothetical protein